MAFQVAASAAETLAVRIVTILQLHFAAAFAGIKALPAIHTADVSAVGKPFLPFTAVTCFRSYTRTRG